MEHVDEAKLEEDMEYRYQFLKDFIGFGPDDVAAIRKVLPQLAPQVPAIVEETYKTMLAYDATARHFVDRHQGFEGDLPSSLADLSSDHAQVKFRKDHLQRYLMNLLGNSFDTKIAKFLDTVGKMHTPKAGKKEIDVPLVQMNAFLGLLADLLTTRLLELDADNDTKIACMRAFHKILWLQNDFINRHYCIAA